MRNAVLILSLCLSFSCKKNEFQSCALHSNLIGEWQSINSDTKNTIIIDENGLIVKTFGVERKLKYEAIACSNFYYENKDYIFYDSEQEEAIVGFLVNSSLDTILTSTGSQDLTKEPILINQMRFIKIK
ncbi:MAG: hypothetical protein ACO1O6_13160 [Bacteroidota bacterium]